MKKGWIIGIVVVVILLLSLWGYSCFQDLGEKKFSNGTSCLSGGMVYQSPAGLGEVKGECCSGLAPISELAVPQTGNLTCEELSVVGGNSICSACGNGNCESGWENRCNCAEDCGAASTGCHAEGETFSTMPLANGGQDTLNCCAGLTRVEGIDVAVCSECGNGVCDTFEGGLKEDPNICPTDCK
jgi:hypothetical protein